MPHVLCLSLSYLHPTCELRRGAVVLLGLGTVFVLAVVVAGAASTSNVLTVLAAVVPLVVVLATLGLAAVVLWVIVLVLEGQSRAVQVILPVAVLVAAVLVVRVWVAHRWYRGL